MYSQWPYDKNTNGDFEPSSLSDAEHQYLSSVKPSWASDGTLVYTTPGSAPALSDGVLINTKASLVAEGKDVRFGTVPHPQDVSC